MTKIVSLEIENVKRVQVVALEPAQKGLTVIGGKNAQGKTTFLDSICYALGGERYRPSNLQREGSAADASIKVKLDNGLLVERSGKNAALKVTDKNGARAGQKLLDSLVEELALNVPKFLAMTDAEKAKVLLSILGIDDLLAVIEHDEKAAYDERTHQGRVADQKEKYAAEMPEWHDVPELPLTATALIAESQAIMTRNAKRQSARQQVADIERQALAAQTYAKQRQDRVVELRAMLDRANVESIEANAAAHEATQKSESAHVATIDPDESTANIEAAIATLEDTNGKVRANADKRKAIDDAENARGVVQELTLKLETIRARRRDLLASVDLPLPGLNVEAGILKYNGQAWDCMSQMERIKVAAAIVRKRKPGCGFILLDGLESFDVEQLAALAAWLEAEDLQAIATRVSTGEECTIIIEDGLIKCDKNASENTSAELDF